MPSTLAKWMPTMLLVGIFTLGVLSFSRLSSAPTATPARAAPPVTTSNASPVKSVSAGGVDADVTALTRQGGTTTLRLSLNNHQYDLSDPSIAQRSSLGGAAPRDWRILQSGSGGHHAEIEAVFEGEERGDFVLGVTDTLTLTIPEL